MTPPESVAKSCCISFNRTKSRLQVPAKTSVPSPQPRFRLHFSNSIWPDTGPCGAKLHIHASACICLNQIRADTGLCGAKLQSHATACICPIQFRSNNGPSGAKLHSLGSRSAPQVCREQQRTLKGCNKPCRAVSVGISRDRFIENTTC